MIALAVIVIRRSGLRKTSIRACLSVLILAIAGIGGSAWAQANGPLPEIGLDFNFNHTDVMMGGHGGIAVPPST